jgi:hypothetical protein
VRRQSDSRPDSCHLGGRPGPRLRLACPCRSGPSVDRVFSVDEVGKKKRRNEGKGKGKETNMIRSQHSTCRIPSPSRRFGKKHKLARFPVNSTSIAKTCNRFEPNHQQCYPRLMLPKSSLLPPRGTPTPRHDVGIGDACQPPLWSASLHSYTRQLFVHCTSASTSGSLHRRAGNPHAPVPEHHRARLGLSHEAPQNERPRPRRRPRKPTARFRSLLVRTWDHSFAQALSAHSLPTPRHKTWECVCG